MYPFGEVEAGDFISFKMFIVFQLLSVCKIYFVKCKPAIAQLVEHLTVDTCSNQMVPGSIPGGRTIFYVFVF